MKSATCRWRSSRSWLRLLQEGEYERLGETITRTADIRLITATNRDLKTRMMEGSFREDLYFRLNVIAVEMPPLRARHGDLLRFANHYLQQFAAEVGRTIEPLSQESISRLEAHSWPGNLRELRNAVQRAVVLCKKNEIDPADFPIDLQVQTAAHVGDLISIQKLVEAHTYKVLDRVGSISASAKVLGIDQATLYRRRRRLGGSFDELPHDRADDGKNRRSHKAVTVLPSYSVC